MEKITLYHKEEDKMYDITLSAEDAQRAASDATFAMSLLNEAVREQHQTEQIATQDENHKVPQVSTINDLQSDSCEEGSLYRWSDPCVLLLLRTYQEMEPKFIDGKNSHKECWELVAKSLKNQGYNVTGSKCASKLRSLKKTYKSIKEHNAKSGNDKRTWQHFEIMEEIFSKKACCNPVAVASSTGLVKNASIKSSTISLSEASCSHDDSVDDEENNENSFENSYLDMKTTQMSISKLLQKRLAQKEMHERKRQKRHDERMNMEEKLINALSQFLNK